MATDEALELAFGEQRPQSRQKQITEDEWRDLMHSLDRIDRRIGRLSHLSVTAISGPLAGSLVILLTHTAGARGLQGL
jgi:hypothetical protein